MEGPSKLRLLIAALLAMVLISQVMVVCSNDRLETQVIKLRKEVERGGFGGGGGTVVPADAKRTPGEPSPVVAVGWNGKRTNVLYVEGVPADAPLRLKDKPRPQNDWYVNRRTSAPSSLNYYATNEGDASTITKYIYGRLVEVDPDAPPAIKPELATSWEIADDKLTYTYHLRRGVQFADGRPFTSADVKFAFDVVRDPEVDSDHLRAGFKDVESIGTPDPHTVVVKYGKKDWQGLYAVGYHLRVLNKGWYEEMIPVYAEKHEIADFSVDPGKPGFGEVFNKIRIPCPGAGPYYIEDDDDFTKTYVNLTQNPFYWGIQGRQYDFNFVRLRWVFIQDAVSAFEAFRKQEFDITVVDADRWEDQLRNDPTITNIADYYEYDHTALHASFVAWNCRKAPFDDPKVRVAMTHLINRQWILDEIERGKGTIAVCPSKRIYPTYSNDLPAKPYDLEKAKALLAEAGWTDSDGDGVLDKGGKRFEFEFKAPSVRTFFKRVAGLLEESCKQVGITMNYRPLEWSTFIEDYYERRFDAIILYHSWSSPWVDNYETYHSSQDKPQGGNAYGWHNKEADKLLEQIREEFDEQKRIEMFHRFNRIFYEEQPETFLIHGEVSVLMNKRFEEAKVRPTGMQLHEFWVKPENVLHGRVEDPEEVK